MAVLTKHVAATWPIELAGTHIFLQLAQMCAQMSLRINCVGSTDTNFGQKKSISSLHTSQRQSWQSILLLEDLLSLQGHQYFYSWRRCARKWAWKSTVWVAWRPMSVSRNHGSDYKPFCLSEQQTYWWFSSICGVSLSWSSRTAHPVKF